jgi:hypothetical protein
MNKGTLGIFMASIILISTYTWADYNDEYRTRGWLNGVYWNHLTERNDEKVKMAYLLGLMDGINVAKGLAKEQVDLIRLNSMMEGLIPLDIKEAIDSTFQEDSNRKLPVYIVMILEVKRMKGRISTELYDKNLQDLREMYSEG